jgi:hypothetical protein
MPHIPSPERSSKIDPDTDPEYHEMECDGKPPDRETNWTKAPAGKAEHGRTSIFPMVGWAVTWNTGVSSNLAATNATMIPNRVVKLAALGGLGYCLACSPTCAGVQGPSGPAVPDAPNPNTPGVQHPLNVSPKRLDFNENIFYRNKLEASVEGGYLPANIPFVFNFMTGDTYTTWPMKYTLVPTIVSLRWHIDNIGGPPILRGNDDFSFSLAYTAIPRGAETRYLAFDYGIRHNFVPRRWRLTPYFEMRGGIGNIDAQGPHGVPYAQGQDLTVTLMMGSGARYNLNPRFSFAEGATFMHVSNCYMSEPRYVNYGINVWGPIFGFNARLGGPRRGSASQ